MQKIHKSSFINEQPVSFNEKSTTTEEFLQLSVEEILIYHHKAHANTTYFYLSDNIESNKLLFLVTQEEPLREELKLLKPNREKTLDIFQQTVSNDFTSVTIKKLLENLSGNQGDYEIELDDRGYSFRLVRGIKVRNLLEKIDIYHEELENIKEYDSSARMTKVKI